MANADEGWASCPLTENGFVRIISQPAYPGTIGVAAAMDLLGRTRIAPLHQFWPADLSILDALDRRRVYGPRQLTDLYLLALAVRHDGRLVTFDERIPRSAIADATAGQLVVIGQRE